MKNSAFKRDSSFIYIFTIILVKSSTHTDCTFITSTYIHRATRRQSLLNYTNIYTHWGEDYFCGTTSQMSQILRWKVYTSCCGNRFVCYQGWTPVESSGRKIPHSPHPSFLLPLYRFYFRFIDTRLERLRRQGGAPLYNHSPNSCPCLKSTPT